MLCPANHEGFSGSGLRQRRADVMSGHGRSAEGMTARPQLGCPASSSTGVGEARVTTPETLKRHTLPSGARWSAGEGGAALGACELALGCMTFSSLVLVCMVPAFCNWPLHSPPWPQEDDSSAHPKSPPLVKCISSESVQGDPGNTDGDDDTLAEPEIPGLWDAASCAPGQVTSLSGGHPGRALSSVCVSPASPPLLPITGPPWLATHRGDATKGLWGWDGSY